MSPEGPHTDDDLSPARLVDAETWAATYSSAANTVKLVPQQLTGAPKLGTLSGASSKSSAAADGISKLLSLLLFICASWTACIIVFALPLPLWAGAVLAVGWLSLIVIVRKSGGQELAASRLIIIGTVILSLVWLWKPASAFRTWTDGQTLTPQVMVVGEDAAIAQLQGADPSAKPGLSLFSLLDLQSVDLMVLHDAAYMPGRTLLSFGFKDGRRICMSLVPRLEKGEQITWHGTLFRNYETFAQVETEEHLIRSTSGGPKPDVMHLNLPVEQMRALFQAWADRVNRLHSVPEWYGPLTQPAVAREVAAHTLGADRMRWDLRTFFPQWLGKVLKDSGDLTTGSNQPLGGISWTQLAPATGNQDFSSFLRGLRECLSSL